MVNNVFWFSTNCTVSNFMTNSTYLPSPNTLWTAAGTGFSISTSFDHARRLVDEDRVIVVVEVADGLGRGGLVARRRRAVAHGLAVVTVGSRSGRQRAPRARAPVRGSSGWLAVSPAAAQRDQCGCANNTPHVITSDEPRKSKMRLAHPVSIFIAGTASFTASFRGAEGDRCVSAIAHARARNRTRRDAGSWHVPVAV